MTDKILSIIVASYHAADYLKKGIPTFLDKRILDELEILIIDDGSKDETADVADDFQKRYPGTVVALHKENGGHGSVINAGIDRAAGKYLCVVDADDWVNTEGLVQLIESLRQTESDLVLTRAQLRCGDNRLVKEWKVDKFPVGKVVPIEAHIAQLRKIEMHNCCMRTKMLREHHVRCHEHHFYTDLEWVMYSLLYVKTVISLDIVFYQYLVGREGQSVSIPGRREHRKDYEDIGNWLSEFYVQNKTKMQQPLRIHYTRRIAEFLTGIYSLLMSYRTEEKKRELMEYDRTLKDRYPEIYRANENICVKILRQSDFRLYSAASYLYCKINRI